MKYGHKSDSTTCLFFREAPPDNYILFLNGPLSKLDPSPLTLGSTSFPTAEHAYHWRACIEYMREDLAEKIVHRATPMEAKHMVSAIKKDYNWYDINYSVMKEVQKAKLKSNSKFRDALLLSEDKILVEAQPDMWWGAGCLIILLSQQIHYIIHA